jgi:hypothetical protein
MPDIPKEVFKEMPEIIITENGVEKLLQNLNPNKACGPDELAPRLLKELAHDLTPIVTMIFQRSLEACYSMSDLQEGATTSTLKLETGLIDLHSL